MNLSADARQQIDPTSWTQGFAEVSKSLS